jgi:hypothetical protein
VTAIAINLEALAPSGDSGFLEAYPDGLTRPNTLSNIQFNDTQAFASTVILPVGTGTNYGKIVLYNGSASPINMVGDLSGYFTTSAGGEYYHALGTERLLDTRQTTAIPSNSHRSYPNPISVTADNPTLVVNLTVVNPTDSGWANAYPNGQASPGTSLIDFAAGVTNASLALVNTASSNSYIVQNASASANAYLVDLSGYFS